MATSPSVVAGEKWFPSGVTVKGASGVSAEAALPCQVLVCHLRAQVCQQLRQSSQLCKLQPRPQQGGSGSPWGPQSIRLAPPCSCLRHAGFPLECKSHGGRNLRIGLTAESLGPKAVQATGNRRAFRDRMSGRWSPLHVAPCPVPGAVCANSPVWKQEGVAQGCGWTCVLKSLLALVVNIVDQSVHNVNFH